MSISVYDLMVDCSIPYQHIETFSLENIINKHATLTVLLFLGDDVKEKALMPLKNTEIVLRHRQSNEIYFHGIVATQLTQLRKNDLYLELTAFSQSINSDIQQKSQTFQNEAQHYDQIFQQIAQKNQGNYSAVVNTKHSIGTWMLQNKITDWEFLLEMARRLKTFIVVDETAPLFSFEVGIRK